jgi:hypothetical protein
MLVRSIFLHHTHPQRDRCVEVALENGPTFSVRGLGDSSVFASRSLTFTRKAPRSCALLTTAPTKLCTIDHSLTELTAARIGADLVEMDSRLTFSPLADGSHLKHPRRHLFVAANPHSPVIGCLADVRTGLINSLGVLCGNADSGGDVPTCCTTDPSGGCTGTAMPAGTSAPMPLRCALLPAARPPITVGFRVPDGEAYLEADGHRLLAH